MTATSPAPDLTRSFALFDQVREHDPQAFTDLLDDATHHQAFRALVGVHGPHVVAHVLRLPMPFVLATMEHGYSETFQVRADRGVCGCGRMTSNPSNVCQVCRRDHAKAAREERRLAAAEAADPATLPKAVWS